MNFWLTPLMNMWNGRSWNMQRVNSRNYPWYVKDFCVVNQGVGLSSSLEYAYYKNSTLYIVLYNGKNPGQV